MMVRNSPAAMVRGGMMVSGAKPSPKWVDDTVNFFFQPNGFSSGILFILSTPKELFLIITPEISIFDGSFTPEPIFKRLFAACSLILK